jgi:hypothetical protein
MIRNSIQLLIVLSFSTILACNAKITSGNPNENLNFETDPGTLDTSTPETMDLKFGTQESPEINQFVLINHAGGPVTRFFTFKVNSKGRLALDVAKGKLALASDCANINWKETRRLETIANGVVQNSIEMIDPRGEVVEPGRNYRISYEFSQLPACSKMVANLPAYFSPETVKIWGPLTLTQTSSLNVPVGNQSPFEITMQYSNNIPSVLSFKQSRSGDQNCKFSLIEKWTFAKTSAGGIPSQYSELKGFSDIKMDKNEVLWLKLSASGNDNCASLAYNFQISGLSIDQARFSLIYSISNPPITNSIAEAKAIGCANSKDTFYLEFTNSEFSSKDSRVVDGFGAQRTNINQKKRLETPLRLSYSTSGLAFSFQDLEKNIPFSEVNLNSFGANDWTADVKVTDSFGFGFPSSQGAYFCELYKTRLFASEVKTVVYNCEGLEKFNIYFNRPFSAEPLIEYENEKTFFGNPGACDSYYNSFPLSFTEPVSAKGKTFSRLDWITIGGVLSYRDAVYYKWKGDEKSDYYARRFDSPDWNLVTGTAPPKQFNIKRTDIASWYTSSDSKCKNSPQFSSSYICKLAP